MELFDVKLPNGEVLEYVDTTSPELTEYFVEMGYDISKVGAYYTAYNDIKTREMNQTINGTSVSVTSVDAVGLLQVQAAFGLGVPSTDFSFENGTVMVMQAATFAVFAGQFAAARSAIMAEKQANRASLNLV